MSNLFIGRHHSARVLEEVAFFLNLFSALTTFHDRVCDIFVRWRFHPINGFKQLKTYADLGIKDSIRVLKFMLLILKLKRRENKDITAKIRAPRRERHSGRGLPLNLHEIFDEVIHIGRTGARTINLKCKINIFEERIFGSGWGLSLNFHGILYQLMNIGRAGQIRVYGTRDHTADRQRGTAKR